MVPWCTQGRRPETSDVRCRSRVMGVLGLMCFPVTGPVYISTLRLGVRRHWTGPSVWCRRRRQSGFTGSKLVIDGRKDLKRGKGQIILVGLFRFVRGEGRVSPVSYGVKSNRRRPKGYGYWRLVAHRLGRESRRSFTG